MDALTDALETDNAVFTDRLPLVPPGMTGDDVPLYADWVQNPIPVPLKTFFNVRVGPPIADLRTGASPDAALTAQLLALRIDMLTWDGLIWWIVEFHRQAALPQFGRLIAYPELLRITYNLDPPLRSLAVVSTFSPFVLPLFTAQKIPIITYPGAGSPPRVANPDALL